MGKKKIVKDEGPAGAPDWVVTFTDMISLLVTFFVLLMTFSSMEEYDYLKVDALLSGNTGVMENRGSVLPDTPEEDFVAATDLQRGAVKPHVRPPDKLHENLEEMGQKVTDQHLEMTFDHLADGLVIEFGREEGFDRGSADLSPALRQSLGEIGRVLENYPHLLVVEGFTDSRFTGTTHLPTAEDLSFARASAAADALVEASGMPAVRVQVAGHGAADPRASNADPEGRLMNRRVQIRVLSLSKLRASYLEGDLR
jgi:chemotaxis protein MotB